METFKAFERYIAHLSEGLGHADRHAGLKGYCTGLMLPLARKSVEPIAASLDPQHVSARHQALHHFVARSEWSDDAVLERVRQWVTPWLDLQQGCYWIVDDTGFPKKGKHSVGVARQYCGQLGKQDTCQVAVSLSLASSQGSVPLAYQLYLPQDWADDPVRRQAAGVPEEITFATKSAIALAQMRRAIDQGVRAGVVLADAGYGDETAFRDGLTALSLLYAVGIRPATTVWAPGTAPLPPKAWVGRGKKPTKLRREPGNEPVSVKALAMSLAPELWQRVSWREGSNDMLSGRFAALRVRAAHRDYLQTEMRAQEWLLIEWPEGDKEPAKYFLSTAPDYATLEQLVFVTKMRWRIERDYQDLKQDFGLGHFEGRGWRGFHHHATLSIAAYGFLMAQRLKKGLDAQAEIKKNFAQRQVPVVPDDFMPRGSPARPAPCARLDHDAAHSVEH
ncbi:MAG: IS701 family transposase [Polaromonas sp.]|nr:IS701 family transposase [Polaromonas sp.]